MYIRRIITKFDLRLHGFKQMEDDKNIWFRQGPTSYKNSIMIYKYYWKERILEFICCGCIGGVEYRGKFPDEREAYSEIIRIKALLNN